VDDCCRPVLACKGAGWRGRRWTGGGVVGSHLYQRRSAGAGSPVAVSRTLRAAVASPGRPLGDQVRTQMEGWLGHDSSRVRECTPIPHPPAPSPPAPVTSSTIGTPRVPSRRMRLSSSSSWVRALPAVRKRVLVADDGERTIAVQDRTRSHRNGLYHFRKIPIQEAYVMVFTRAPTPSAECCDGGERFGEESP
jgi:hypothetical protein